MAEYNDLYQRAAYYDLVFDRDVSREVDFFDAAYRHYTGLELRAVLDLACGPGYHARACARRGLRAAGLDLRPEMLAFAQDKAAAEGINVEWLAADMRYFQLSAPVDAALCMFDGLDALLTDEDIVQHFRTIAANLSPGGLYFIEMTHPRDCFWQNYGAFYYAGQRDGTEVKIIWATNRPQFDLVTGVAQVDIEMRVCEPGRPELVIHDSAAERLADPIHIRLLAMLSTVLHVIGWYGDFDLNQPLDHSPASRRAILILQKTEAGLDHG